MHGHFIGATRGPIIQLDVYSDVICPWCYIGKRRLDRALEMGAGGLAGSGGLQIRYLPFQLNPGMAPGGMERQAYLAWKFGGADRAAFVYERILQEGREDGIAFAFDRIKRTPNTVNAHRAILFAQQQGDGAAMVEGLFAAYFTQGRDIGSSIELVRIGGECGFNETRLRDHLLSDTGRDEIAASNERAQGLGINAVPCFVIDGSEALSGAQPPEVFLRLFDFARNHGTISAT